MDFAERLSALATKVAHQKAALETEEATKNAFVMPFISTILGYDVFNPSEVVPEFTADVGVKKGEKIDYAIVQDGQIQMLIECKHVGSPLSLEHASQLYRYFAVTNARIAVLTNGEKYHFYTDLDAPNRMDAKPFLVLDLLDIDTTLLPELLKLSKTEFDLDSIISAAGELKYVGQIKRAIAAEFKDPSDDWIRFFTNRVYEGAFTQKVREQFTPLVGKASQQFLNEQVNNRLATALGAGSTPPPLPQKSTLLERSAAKRKLCGISKRPRRKSSRLRRNSPPSISCAPSSVIKWTCPESHTGTRSRTARSFWTTTIERPLLGCTSTAARSTSASWMKTRLKLVTLWTPLSRSTR